MHAHRVAKLAAVAAFLLLIIGGMVNATGSSLACKEPTLLCNGKFLPAMTGGVLYEHGHRLFAMTVGLLQIVLTWQLWKRGDKKLGALLLGMVLLQGTFGAITVGLKLKWYVSTGHFLLGMSYFAMLVYTIFRTRPAPSVVELEQHAKRVATLGPARWWIGFAMCAVMFQMLLGALVRHLGATTSCIAIPYCSADGSWGSAPREILQMIHRGVGVIVAVIVCIAAVKVALRARAWPSLRLLMWGAPVLVAAQVALGIFTVLTMRAVPLAVLHFAGATSLWALWASAWLVTGPRLRATTYDSGPMPRVAEPT
jgi:cytochrome c oxidase assembly protein subunit 15